MTLEDPYEGDAELDALMLDTIMEVSGLERLVKGRFIDIGCGNGETIREIEKLHPTLQFSGVDRSPKAVAAARQNNPQADIRQGYFSAIPFKSGEFDVAFSTLIFDYAGGDLRHPSFRKSFNVADLAREVHRILRNGGIYIIFEGERPRWEIEPFGRLLIPVYNFNNAHMVFQKAT